MRKIHKIIFSEDRYFFIDNRQFLFLVQITADVIREKQPCDFSKYSYSHSDVIVQLQEAGLVAVEMSGHNRAIQVNPLVIGIIAKQFYEIRDQGEISKLILSQYPYTANGINLKEVLSHEPMLIFKKTFPGELKGYIESISNEVVPEKYRYYTGLTADMASFITSIALKPGATVLVNE